MTTATLRLWLLLPLLWLGSLGLAYADGEVQPVPALDSRVTDLAGVLSADQRQQLEQQLASFEQQKGSQIAVLLVHTTRPEDIFSYSFRVADAWKLGRKGVDDGVLLVVATDDHADHIQVGYGLEGALPDVVCKRILQDIMAPHFHQGDFAGGVSAGVDAIIKAVNGEPLPAPSPRGSRNGDGNGWVAALVIGMFASMFLQSLLGRGIGGFAGGALGGGIALLAGTGLVMAIGIGFMVMLLVWLGSIGGGFGGGGYWGGGGGGFSGGGGGGFSGGGGGFGGGGASGNW